MIFLTLYLPWFIEPWNLHVVDVGILGIFYLLFRNKNDLHKFDILLVGLLAGWMFSTRYLDIFWIFPMFAVLIIFKPKKILYLIPGILIVLLVLFSHVYYFDDALELPHVYRQVYSDFEHPMLVGMPFHAYDWEIKIISERLYCILFEPLYCVPASSGNQEVDNHWYYSLWDKTPILASASVFLIFSPFGIVLILKKFHGYQRWIIIALLIGFVSAMISYNASAHFAAGYSRFFRYEMMWIPLFSVFSFIGIYHLYNRFFSRN